MHVDINDFDDAAIGPWRLDVLRLLTSLLLAGRELRVGGPRLIELSGKLLDTYVGAAFLCVIAIIPTVVASYLLEGMPAFKAYQIAMEPNSELAKSETANGLLTSVHDRNRFGRHGCPIRNA